MTKYCLFCKSQGPFTTAEHIIPQSLGNNEEILRGEVCDNCQNYFGKEIENFVLSKTPIGFWRVYLGVKTKKGNFPSIDLSMPARNTGLLPNTSSYNDNNVGFTSHEDASISVEINDDKILQNLLSGSKTQFKFVLSPNHLVQLGRFLGKMAIELLAQKDPSFARSEIFSKLIKYTRFGIEKEIWPIFYSQIGELSEVRKRFTEKGKVETSASYQHKIMEFENYWLFNFLIGTDLWVICLNDPCPPPVIRQAFTNEVNLNLIWYSIPEWKSS
jgi:hypothetical protein